MSQRPGPVCRNMGGWALEGAIKQWILGVPQFEQNPGDSMEARNQEKYKSDNWMMDDKGMNMRI